MVRDLVTEQEVRSVPVPIPEQPAPPKRKQVNRPAQRQREFSPSKRIKSMYRRAHIHIPLREWARQLRGSDKEIADAWFSNK
jgi:hypothetical protein